jgi:hypothetical protein
MILDYLNVEKCGRWVILTLIRRYRTLSLTHTHTHTHTHNVKEMMRDYGFVEPYPQRWHYMEDYVRYIID